MALKTYRWDMADYIETYEDVDAHLKIAYEDHDPSHVENVINAIVRSKAMSKLAEKWAVDGRIGAYIQEQSEKTLQAYGRQPYLVAEHANTEEDTAARRLCTPPAIRVGAERRGHTIAVGRRANLDTADADTSLLCRRGRAIDEDGVKALMFSHLSPKRGTDEIGRFGLVPSRCSALRTRQSSSVSPAPSASTEQVLRRSFATSPRTPRASPVLRLPEAIHPIREAATDPILREMMGWATNIVRLPLKPEAHQSLDKQIEDFPAEFLLFVEHVGRLVLQRDEQEVARIITLTREDDRWILDDGGKKSTWMIEKRLQQAVCRCQERQQKLR